MRVVVAMVMAMAVCGPAWALSCLFPAEWADLTVTTSTLDGVDDGDDLGVEAVYASPANSIVVYVRDADNGIVPVYLSLEGAQ